MFLCSVVALAVTVTSAVAQDMATPLTMRSASKSFDRMRDVASPLETAIGEGGAPGQQGGKADSARREGSGKLHGRYPFCGQARACRLACWNGKRLMVSGALSKVKHFLHTNANTM
jgi:hypothetical protein